MKRFNWVEDYILLVLRMDRAFSRVDSSFFLDTYYGPNRLKEIAQNERQKSFTELAKIAIRLKEELLEQQFDLQREEFLGSQVDALLTVAGVMAGVELPFYEEVERIFGIEPTWISEDEFEHSLKLMDAALYGKGDLRIRYQTWMKSMQLPAEKWEVVLPMMQEILSEARRRTKQLVALPEKENLEIKPMHAVNYGAANWYQGDFRSRLELNLDRPVYTFLLLYQMCHEAYPGHHTESCMKEQTLFREKGYLEQSVYFALGPQLMISEGIAVVAPQMIFSLSEAAEWIRTHIDPLLGLQKQEADLEKMLEAYTVISPDDLGSNLATLIEAGRSDEQVLEYTMAYSPYSKEQVRGYLATLSSPLSRLYSFSYSQGSRLIRPLLTGENRNLIIKKLLTEQLTPRHLRQLAE